jgi:hypothetical protein
LPPGVTLVTDAEEVIVTAHVEVEREALQAAVLRPKKLPKLLAARARAFCDGAVAVHRESW